MLPQSNQKKKEGQVTDIIECHVIGHLSLATRHHGHLSSRPHVIMATCHHGRMSPWPHVIMATCQVSCLHVYMSTCLLVLASKCQGVTCHVPSRDIPCPSIRLWTKVRTVVYLLVSLIQWLATAYHSTAATYSRARYSAKFADIHRGKVSVIWKSFYILTKLRTQSSQ